MSRYPISTSPVSRLNVLPKMKPSRAAKLSRSDQAVRGRTSNGYDRPVVSPLAVVAARPAAIVTPAAMWRPAAMRTAPHRERRTAAHCEMRRATATQTAGMKRRVGAKRGWTAMECPARSACHPVKTDSAVQSNHTGMGDCSAMGGGIVEPRFAGERHPAVHGPLATERGFAV